MTLSESRRAGLLLGAAGVAVLSPDALMVRLFDGDNFALAAGRGLALAVFAGILTAALPTLRRGFRWRPIAIYGAIYAAGLASFPMSVRHTHVANTVVILAVAPLLSAVGARWFLGETISTATWIACAAAAVGIGIVFAPQLSAGGGLGNWLALLTALSLAGCAIVIRANPTVSFAPGFVLGGLLCFAVYAPFAKLAIANERHRPANRQRRADIGGVFNDFGGIAPPPAAGNQFAFFAGVGVGSFVGVACAERKAARRHRHRRRVYSRRACPAFRRRFAPAKNANITAAMYNSFFH